MPTLTLRDGSTTDDPRLDRIRYTTPKQLGQYPVAEVLEAPAPKRGKTWPVPYVLDQGREGACVGFSIATEAIASPVQLKRTPDAATALARRLYHRATELDPWAETTPQSDLGTSIDAGGLAAIEEGLCTEFRWARDVDELARALTVPVGAREPVFGPGIAGVEWRDGMYEAAERRAGEAIVDVSGRIVGGHAILVRGVLLAPARYGFTRRLFRWRNTWGPGYGEGGDALIADDDLAAILGPQPELMFLVDRRA